MPNSTGSFNPTLERFIGIVDGLALPACKTRYTFTSLELYERTLKASINKGMQIYWVELLGRAHLTSVTSILRNRQWVSALSLAIQNNNLLAFAAAFRGFIESSADGYSALKNLPRCLARDYESIASAVSGTLDLIFSAPQLEDDLIHFQYARKLTKGEISESPKSHETKKVRDYLEEIERGGIPDLVAAYSYLCDLTHPSATSVWMFIRPINDFEIELGTNQDGLMISDFLAKYEQTLIELFMFAFNPGIVTLRVLMEYPLTTFHVPGVRNCDLSSIPLWQKCAFDLSCDARGHAT